MTFPSWHLLAAVLIVGVSNVPPSFAQVLSVIFPNGELAPGLPDTFRYAYQIPAIVVTPEGALFAFAQAFMHLAAVTPVEGALQTPMERLGDGDDGWIDIVGRRSTDGGRTWGELVVICRNSTGTVRTARTWHACQQPTPIVDNITNTILLLSSLDNWHQRLVTSTDDGITWTPWAEARDLDNFLRRAGWGLVFNGLPGGIQLRTPSPHAGRLIACSSSYRTGGSLNPDGSIHSAGDQNSRYSFAMYSDDHGITWSMSDLIGPHHTTECSIGQSFDGPGRLYLYTRIWDSGRPTRGIAMSEDGGTTWTNATGLYGLADSAPDCEGSFISVPHRSPAGAGTCFFVSAPYSASRQNLTVQGSCGAVPGNWSIDVIVDDGPSSYSALAFLPNGGGEGGTVVDAYAFSTTGNLNESLRSDPTQPLGGIRLAKVLQL